MIQLRLLELLIRKRKRILKEVIKFICNDNKLHLVLRQSLKKEKAIIVQSNRVTITKGLTFGFVLMMDFLEALAKKFKRNTTSFKNYQHIFVTQKCSLKGASNEALRVNVLFKRSQDMLSNETTVIGKTDDCLIARSLNS